MEANLAKNPRLVPFNVQVVAAPDDFAGEVPVAVTEITASPDLVVEIQKTLRDTMGREYVPDEVISAEELGLTTYPRTILGKVKKEQIAKLVKEYRTRHDLPQNKDSDTKMAAEVREIWARSVGLPADRLTDDAALTDFADSITVMRVRDKMKRQTGRNLTIVEIAEAGTIGNIIKLLEARAPEEAEMTRQRTVHRKGPPSAEDMEYLVDDLEMVRTTKNAIINAVSSYGFRWNDVQDVMPAYDFNTVMASTGVMDSWNFKFAILPSHKFDKQVRLAKREDGNTVTNRIYRAFVGRSKLSSG
jgi:aryl carrier-like protein